MSSNPNLTKTQKRNNRKRKAENATGKTLLRIAKKRSLGDLSRTLMQWKNEGRVISQSDYQYVDDAVRTMIDHVYGQQSTSVVASSTNAPNVEIGDNVAEKGKGGDEKLAAERKDSDAMDGEETIVDNQQQSGEVLSEGTRPGEVAPVGATNMVGAEEANDLEAGVEEQEHRRNNEVVVEDSHGDGKGEDAAAELDVKDAEEKVQEEEETLNLDFAVEENIVGGDEEGTDALPDEEGGEVLGSSDTEEPIVGFDRFGDDVSLVDTDVEEKGSDSVSDEVILEPQRFAEPHEHPWNNDDPVDWSFLNNVNVLDLAEAEEFVSVGNTELREMGVQCNQFPVDETFLRCLITVEKCLPKSKYSGYARPVRYAPFYNLVDPFIESRQWPQMTEGQRITYGCLCNHFMTTLRLVYGLIEPYQKFSFLYTDVSNFTVGRLQIPHVDMHLDSYKDFKVYLAFMPLTSRGMFLEVWPPDQREGEVVFIKYGTVFFLDKSVYHAGGFSPGGTEAKRVQFCFSEVALDVGHFQVKGREEDYEHNVAQIINEEQVRTKFVTKVEE